MGMKLRWRDRFRPLHRRRRNCAWWIRGYHRRQRKADIVMLWPALVRAARRQGVEPARVEEAWELSAWESPHWYCACTMRDRECEECGGPIDCDGPGKPKDYPAWDAKVTLCCGCDLSNYPEG